MSEWVKLAGYENNDDTDKPRLLTKVELDEIERKLNDEGGAWYFPAPLAADKESAELSRQNTIKFILVSLDGQKICPSAVNELLTRCIETHFKKLISPGSPIGCTAAEAVGASTTQMTLNSVAPWEQLLIQDYKGVGHIVEIGSWIDEILAKNKEKVIHIPENRTQYCELEYPVKIVTSDNNGKVTWEDVTAVMRHIPVGNLVKIKTKSGREVTATQQKSFLVWDKKLEKLVQVNGMDLKLKDLVPIANQIPDPPVVYDYLDLKKYLSPKEWMYISEMKEVQRRYDNYGSTKAGVWNLPRMLDFIPHNRGDSFQRAYGILTLDGLLDNDYIYPKSWGGSKNTKIPEKILLNKQFGQIVGLYLAEGCVSDTFVDISNNDDKIRKMVADWCDSIGVTYRTVKEVITKGLHQGTSTSIIIHSVLFARLFKRWLNTGSANKIMPEEILFGNREFIIGVLDGYFAGDGTVHQDNGTITISSVSRDLIDGTIFLCGRLGIFGKRSGHQTKKNNKGSKNIKYTNTFNIRNWNADLFGELVGSCHKEKDEKMKRDYKRNAGWGQEYIKHENIMLDPIVRIDYVSDIEHVYDLTVPATLNFCLRNSLVVEDSFHQSGQQKSASFGIDAMRDIILARKIPKFESCTIYYKKQAITYEEVLNSRQYIVGSMISDFVKDYEIKSPEQLEKKWWHYEESLFDNELPDAKRVLRLHLDLVQMYKHRVTIEDIALILKKKTPSPKQEIPSRVLPRYGPMEDAIIDLYPTADIHKNLEDVVTKYSQNSVPQDIAETTFLDTIVYPELSKIRVKGLAGIRDLYPRVIPIWSMVLTEKKLTKEEITADIISPQDTFSIIFNQIVMKTHGFIPDNLAALCQAAGMKIIGAPDENRLYVQMPTDRYRTSKNQVVIRIGDVKYARLDINALTPFLNNYYEEVDEDLLKREGDFYLIEIEKEKTKTEWIEEKVPAVIDVVPVGEVENLDGKYYRLLKNLVSIANGVVVEFDPLLNIYQDLTDNKIKVTEMKPGEYVNDKIAAAKRTYKADVDKKINDNLAKKERVPVNLKRPFILQASELVIADTDGSNFRELLGLRSIDKRRTTCNNMHTIAETIGIEAARTFVIRQLRDTIANTGSYIHPAHILFIAEFITSRGSPYGATYTGISKQPHGPLSLATVERAGKTFTQNALFGRKEDIRNVSASVAVGTRMAAGNGMFDIAQDIVENGKKVTLINDDVFDASKRDDTAKAAEEQRAEQRRETERSALFAPIEETESEIDKLDDPVPEDRIITGVFPSNTGKITISSIKPKVLTEPTESVIISTGLVTSFDTDVVNIEAAPVSLETLFEQYQAKFLTLPEYYSRERLPTVPIPRLGPVTGLQRSLLSSQQERLQGLQYLG